MLVVFDGLDQIVLAEAQLLLQLLDNLHVDLIHGPLHSKAAARVLGLRLLVPGVVSYLFDAVPLLRVGYEDLRNEVLCVGGQKLRQCVLSTHYLLVKIRSFFVL